MFMVNVVCYCIATSDASLIPRAKLQKFSTLALLQHADAVNHPMRRWFIARMDETDKRNKKVELETDAWFARVNTQSK